MLSALSVIEKKSTRCGHPMAFTTRFLVAIALFTAWQYAIAEKQRGLRVRVLLVLYCHILKISVEILQTVLILPYLLSTASVERRHDSVRPKC